MLLTSSFPSRLPNCAPYTEFVAAQNQTGMICALVKMRQLRKWVQTTTHTPSESLRQRTFHVRQCVRHYRHTGGVLLEFLRNNFVQCVAGGVVIRKVLQSVLPDSKCRNSLLPKWLNVCCGRIG